MGIGGAFLLDIGWDIIEDVRGTCMMLMFITEESIQTAMMGEYIAMKNEMWQEAIDLNVWIRMYLTGQLIAFTNSNWSLPAYPMNNAYYNFAVATNKTLDIYTALVRKGLGLPV